MEKDDELKGEGNSYTTHFRQYDPRLGRWLSIDPLTSNFPNQSPYVSMDNSPIYFTDVNGDSVSVTYNRKTFKLYVLDYDHYDEKLPSEEVSYKEYQLDGVRDKDGKLLYNQILVINNVHIGGGWNEKTGEFKRWLSAPKQKPIGVGNYDMLSTPNHDNYTRLDLIDIYRYNDKVDLPFTHKDWWEESGRFAYRTYPGTVSHGCVTICGDYYVREAVNDFFILIVKNTTTTRVPDKGAGCAGWWRHSPRYLTKYGTLKVIGEDKTEIGKE